MKKILIVVDMQKDFVDGALGTKEAQAITAGVAAKIRSWEGPIFVTFDTHGEDYMDTREGRFLPVKHCIRGTEGWQLDAAVAAALEGRQYTAVEKPTFGSERLPGLVKAAAGGEPFSLELVGLCTDICVVSNALLLKAAFPETDITVWEDLCAGVTPQSHEAALSAMRSCQILVEKDGGYTFDAEKVKDECVAWIRDFFEKNGPGCNAVIGISGGKDSSIAAALCAEALGRDRVIGVLMPNGEQADIDMSHLLVEHLGIRSVIVNIHDAVEGLKKSIPLELSEQSLTNIPPRIRMATLYAVGQSNNGRVVNTCNLSENWVGYSTRYGDAAGDFSPMANLTTAEIRAIGRLLGLPDVLVDKVPIDGLCGKTDEDNLGFTYAVLDRYIRTGRIDDPDTKANIDRRHRMNLFKLRLMPEYTPELPTI